MEDYARPDYGAKSLDDDVLDAPLKVQLTEVCKLSKIWLMLPLWWCVCMACTGICCTDDWIGVWE